MKDSIDYQDALKSVDETNIEEPEDVKNWENVLKKEYQNILNQHFIQKVIKRIPI